MADIAPTRRRAAAASSRRRASPPDCSTSSSPTDEYISPQHSSRGGSPPSSSSTSSVGGAGGGGTSSSATSSSSSSSGDRGAGSSGSGGKKRRARSLRPPLANRSPNKRLKPSLSPKRGAKPSSSSSSLSSSSLKKRRGSSAASASASPAASAKSASAEGDAAALQQQNVRVVARLRPLSSKEIDEHSTEAITAISAAGTGTASIQVEGGAKAFDYDAVFGPSATQSDVYEGTAGHVVRSNIFRGFNVTILAYGQTGSGKTFTMGTEGGGSSNENSVDETTNDNDDENNAATTLAPPSEGEGIIPRAVHDLFQTRASLPDGPNRVKVELSYLEIYNEEARDLLRSGGGDDGGGGKAAAPPELHIRQGDEGVVVRNLSRHVVGTPGEVADLMREAAGRRVTASTNMNAVSSRSHAVCTLYVTIAPSSDGANERNDGDGGGSDGGEEIIRAKLTLVDLAGSERIKRTGAEGARMREGISINKGLFVLGQVVSALSELGQAAAQQQSQQGGGGPSAAHSHIPYRDSKLTRLLQDSLGGNSRTVMVVCVSPAQSNVEESVNTLRYAERARNIKNSAVRNVVAGGPSSASAAEVAALRRENRMLKLQLLQAQMSASAGPAAAAAAAAAVPGGASLKIMATDGSSGASQDDSIVLQGINVEKLEIVARLRASVTSLKAKASKLEQRNVECAEDALAASLKADKWRQKYECLVAAVKARGIDDVPDEAVKGDADGETLAVQLRRELSELREELRESQTDAEVARATAAAVVAGEGDLSAAEQLALAAESSEEDVSVDREGTNEDGGGDSDSSKLSAELLAVDGEIDRKEAMALQMNKERECMDHLRSHFEEAVQRLQEEVDVLSSEREHLLKKVGVNKYGGSGPSAGKKRSASSKSGPEPTDESAEIKQMRKRIEDLESRIKGLKTKAAEHVKSLRMREMAEKKCLQLAAEIAEDKKRRAALQRQLKESAAQRRSDKKAAQQQAARMLRDSQKMKSELQKVKDAAARQAIVLRRKAAEAVSKQKMLEEQQKKKMNAAAMRGARAATSSVGIQRKEELNSWLEKELECAMTLNDIRDQIEEQTLMLQEASSKKSEILSKGKRQESTAALQSLEMEIGTRESVIDQLEKNIDEIYKSVLGNDGKTPAGSSCFIDLPTWQGLTRREMRLIETNTFERLVQVSKEANELRIRKDESQKSAVQKAVSEERRKAEDAMVKLKMEHSEAMTALLESTKESVKHHLRQDITTVGVGEDDIDPSTKAAIDDMLSSYFSGCERVGKAVKGELNDIREKHESMKNFVDEVAKGIIAKNEATAEFKLTKKKKKSKKETSPEFEEDDFDLFDEEDAGAVEDSDDSDWAPDTPAPQKKRRTNRGAAKKKAERNSTSDDDELAGEKINHPDGEMQGTSSSFESMTVAELKGVLKREGKAISGKKADLIKRLRATKTSKDENTSN